MNVDYIVVGAGLAGVHFCEKLMTHNKSFVVFDNLSQQSSIVAAGLYNPVILKRFTAVWKAQEQLALCQPIYKLLEDKLDVKLDYQLPVYRVLASVEEQNNWFQACDNPKLSAFLSTEIVHEQLQGIKSPFGFGKVLATGRIDTKQLIQLYKDHLRHKGQLIEASFEYDKVKSVNNTIQYNTINAKHIVFAEGFGLKNNPYFNYLPLKGTKGELITIKAPMLKLEAIVKASVFVIPLKDDLFRVGATYEWNDKTNTTSQAAKEELIIKLKSFLECDFSVVEQVAGLRPTVIDRRPLVGQHPKLKNLYVLNGLGTRGVMIAPYVAHQLYHFIEDKSPLESELSITRFD